MSQNIDRFLLKSRPYMFPSQLIEFAHIRTLRSLLFQNNWTVQHTIRSGGKAAPISALTYSEHNRGQLVTGDVNGSISILTRVSDDILDTSFSEKMLKGHDGSITALHSTILFIASASLGEHRHSKNGHRLVLHVCTVSSHILLSPYHPYGL